MLSAWFYALWRTQIAKRTKQLARKLAPLAGFFGSSHSWLLFLTITHFLLSPPHTMTSLASPPHIYRLSSLLTSHSWLLWLLFLTLTFFPLDLALTFSSFQPYTHTLQISYFNSNFYAASLPLTHWNSSMSLLLPHTLRFTEFSTSYSRIIFIKTYIWVPFPIPTEIISSLSFASLISWSISLTLSSSPPHTPKTLW